MLHSALRFISAGFAVTAFVLLYVQWWIRDDDRSIKDRIKHWNEEVQVGDWAFLVAFAMTNSERFLSYLFGPKILSLRYLLVAGTLALIVNLVIFETARSTRLGLSRAQSHHDVLAMFVHFIVANVSIDVVSLAVARWYLRRASCRAAPRVLPDLVVMMIITYLSLGLALGMVTVVVAHISVLDAAVLISVVMMLAWGPSIIIAGPVSSVLLPIVLPAAFSTLVLLSIYCAAVLLYVLRPIIQLPLSHVLQRLADAKQGVLPTLAGGAGACATLIDYFVK